MIGRILFFTLILFGFTCYFDLSYEQIKNYLLSFITWDYIKLFGLCLSFVIAIYIMLFGRLSVFKKNSAYLFNFIKFKILPRCRIKKKEK